MRNKLWGAYKASYDDTIAIITELVEELVGSPVANSSES